MTVHLYLLANDGINMNAAYGTALLLMVIVLAFNLFARFLSRKRRWIKESHVRLSVRSHAGASGHYGQGFQLLVR